ncbi:endonuclease [Roseovarius sp. B08]|uniref:endonuclease n=1 Tax=Roseovarius sp. B08 TaxID=3449223 RepID=UPI003EDC5DA3
MPNPPKPNPPVATEPEPVLPNKADPLNARTGSGTGAAAASTSAAAAGTDKVAMRAETHSGGNDAATAQDPTFTSATTDAEAGAGVDAAPKAVSKPKAKTGSKAKTTAAKPKAKPAETGEEDVGTKPEMLSAPRGGKADNLKEIKGVGPKLEGVLHDMGVYHFDQIAGWTDQEVAWVDANLIGFKGRVSRDNWIDQAKTLAAGGETDFSTRVDKGDVY